MARLIEIIVSEVTEVAIAFTYDDLIALRNVFAEVDFVGAGEFARLSDKREAAFKTIEAAVKEAAKAMSCKSDEDDEVAED